MSGYEVSGSTLLLNASFIELITDSKLPIYGLIGIIYACLLLYLQTKLFV